MPLLEVKDLTVYYGSVLALDKVSFHVNEGEIVAIIGPNGAGKSTALKAICGLIQLTGSNSGDVIFNGRRINHLQPYELVKEGICLVPEGRRIFNTMSVRENLQMGAFTLNDKEKLENRLETVSNLFPRFKERMQQRAGTLSSGEQQMLAIGRALMLKPRLLLVDEPSLGLSPTYVRTVFEKLKETHKSGTAILLVEQNNRTALQYANRGCFFEAGRISVEGNSKHLLSSKKLKNSS